MLGHAVNNLLSLFEINTRPFEKHDGLPRSVLPRSSSFITPKNCPNSTTSGGIILALYNSVEKKAKSS